MAIAQQYYKPGVEFQISSVGQLEKFSSTEYTWTGRHLTSWTNEDGDIIELDKSDYMSNKLSSDLTGNWALNEYDVSATIISENGKVVITSKSNEKPLTAYLDRKDELVKSGVSKILFNSNLSIDCIPNDGYTAIRFQVNNSNLPTEKQYVHSSKTGQLSFKVSADFQSNDIEGLEVLATNGKMIFIPYSNAGNSIGYLGYRYGTGTSYPFNEYSDVANRCTIRSIKDSHNQISSVKGDAFFEGNGETGNRGLVSVDLPSLTSIGESAFAKCVNLSSISIPHVSSLPGGVFGSCEKLQSVYAPNLLSVSTGSVSFGSFSKSAISSADFPKLEFCGPLAFQFCNNLSSASLHNLSSIGRAAFYGCSKLTDIDIPNVVKIDNQVFQNCTSLSSINCNNISSIGDNSFDSCKNLVSVDFPQLMNIGGYAFQNCSSLASFENNNISSVASSTFSNCNSLSNISVPNVKTINGSSFQNCYNLLSLNIPHLKTINGNFAFENCSSLTSFDFPSLEYIGAFTFQGCKNIQFANISSTYTIGQNAFTNCSSLTSLDMQQVKKIEQYAFSNCSSIVSISLSDVESVPSMYSKNSFSGTPYGISCYVPDYLVNEFVTFGSWKQLHDDVKDDNHHFEYIGVNTEEKARFRVYTSDGCTCHFKYSQLEDGVLRVFKGTSGTSDIISPFKDNPYTNKINTIISIDDSYGKISAIGDYAFYNYQINLTSVNVPQVEKIGQHAFFNLHNLKEIRMTQIQDIPVLLDAHAFYRGGYQADPVSCYVPAFLIEDFMNDEKWKEAYDSKYVDFVGVGDKLS